MLSHQKLKVVLMLRAHVWKQVRVDQTVRGKVCGKVQPRKLSVLQMQPSWLPLGMGTVHAEATAKSAGPSAARNRDGIRACARYHRQP